MFDKSERWVDELSSRVRHEGSLTNSAGYMPLPEIIQEIREACAEPRPHDYLQAYDWVSRAADLQESLEQLGVKCHALLEAPVRALHTVITSELAPIGSRGKPKLDDTKRASVAVKAEALDQILGIDDVIVAAWRDLVDGCKSTDFTEFPDARVAFLRDSVVSLSGRRRQDSGHFSPLALAAGVMARNSHSVWEAKWIAGDRKEVDELPRNEHKVDIDDVEADALAALIVTRKPRTGMFVVWFRFYPAFVTNRSCESHGDVTFYDSLVLSTLLCDHDRARQAFAVVPEELLTEKIRDRQLARDIDDDQGFEH